MASNTEMEPIVNTGIAEDIMIHTLPSRRLMLHVNTRWRILENPDFEVQQLVLYAFGNDYKLEAQVRYTGTTIDQITLIKKI